MEIRSIKLLKELEDIYYFDPTDSFFRVMEIDGSNKVDTEKSEPAFCDGEIPDDFIFLPEGQAKEYVQFIHDNYDRIVYIMEKETGLYFSDDIARNTLKRFVYKMSWQHRLIRWNNIPWVLLNALEIIDLKDCLVKKDSNLYHYFQTRGKFELVKDETLENYYSVHPLNLSKHNKKAETIYAINFFDFRFIRQKEAERLTMAIGKGQVLGNYVEIEKDFKKFHLYAEIENVNYFVHVCKERPDWKPNEKQLAIADEVLGKLI